MTTNYKGLSMPELQQEAGVVARLIARDVAAGRHPCPLEVMDYIAIEREITVSANEETA